MEDRFQLALYDYTLPPELIAQSSVQPHHNARLLVIDRDSATIEAETTYYDLDSCIPSDRVIFFNDSRVLRARISLDGLSIFSSDGREKRIQSGEIFFLKVLDDTCFEALVRPGKVFQIGSYLFLDGRKIVVKGITNEGRILELEGGGILGFFETHGALPLPPYIEYREEKEKDYQTVFAKELGSVAAPTASLHFTRELLDKLKHETHSITLHVGLGTFRGIQTEDIRDFPIHEEMIEIQKEIFSIIANIRIDGKSVLAVGTTVCRTLESLPYLWKILSADIRQAFPQNVQDFWDSILPDTIKYVQAYTTSGETIYFSTKIYIYEGFVLRIVQDLITNFHLPKSSLLVLVSTFLSREKTLALYQYAIEQKYRFFSFGDGMYIRGK